MRSSIALLSLISVLLSRPGLAGDETLVGRKLGAVLSELRESGARILYSDRLVRDGMVVESEPARKPLTRLLYDLLTPDELAARRGPGAYYTVVRASSVSASVPSRPTPRRDPSGTLNVAIEVEGRVMPGLRVTLAGVGGVQLTDDAGTCSWVGVRPGTYELAARSTGGASARRPLVSISAGETTTTRLKLPQVDVSESLTLTLSERLGFSETVDVISASAEELLRPGRLAMGTLEILDVAGSIDNVFRALHTLPAVEPMNEFDSRFSAYGGGPDENLTLLDGVEIHNPYRL